MGRVLVFCVRPFAPSPLRPFAFKAGDQRLSTSLLHQHHVLSRRKSACWAQFQSFPPLRDCFFGRTTAQSPTRVVPEWNC